MGDLAHLDALIAVRIALALERDEPPTLRQAGAEIGQALRLALGTGAGSANQFYSIVDDVPPDAHSARDLTGLGDSLGCAVGFSTVRALMIANLSHVPYAPYGFTPTDAVLGLQAYDPGEGDAWLGPFADLGDSLLVPPRGTLLAVAPTAAGWPVTGEPPIWIVIRNPDPTDWALYHMVLVGEAIP